MAQCFQHVCRMNERTNERHTGNNPKIPMTTMMKAFKCIAHSIESWEIVVYRMCGKASMSITCKRLGSYHFVYIERLVPIKLITKKAHALRLAMLLCYYHSSYSMGFHPYCLHFQFLLTVGLADEYLHAAFQVIFDTMHSFFCRCSAGWMGNFDAEFHWTNYWQIQTIEFILHFFLLSHSIYFFFLKIHSHPLGQKESCKIMAIE